MEEIPEQLPQVGVVGLVVKTQGAAEIQVRGELSYETRDAVLTGTPRLHVWRHDGHHPLPHA